MPLSPALVPTARLGVPPPLSISHRPGPQGHRPGPSPLRALLTPHVALPETCYVSGLGSPGQVSTQVQPRL